MEDSLYRDWTGRIVGAYHTVFSDLPRGFPELFYENAMIKVLRSQGLQCRQRPKFEIWHKDQRMGAQQLDLFVAEKIVVKLETAAKPGAVHIARTYSYMKVTSSQLGLLLSFGDPQPDFKRIAWDVPAVPAEPPQAMGAELAQGVPHSRLTAAILDAAIEVHRSLGPGFTHAIYGNACHYELWTDRIPTQPQRRVQVFFRDWPIGQLKLNHLVVANRVMLFPVAVQDIERINLDILRCWLRRNDMRLGVLVNFLDTRVRPVFVTDTDVDTPADSIPTYSDLERGALPLPPEAGEE
jgi:GxxExxY protein